jgi:hypothetical protein
MGQYKDEHGTTRIGDLLRNLGDVGKPILQAAGSLTGQAWLTKVADGITTSKDLREEQKTLAFEMLKFDTNDRANERDNVTKRWEKDMTSDSWLSKNVRPLILLWSWLMVSAYGFVDLLSDFSLSTTFIQMLSGAWIAVNVAFFGGREWQKHIINKKEK